MMTTLVYLGLHDGRGLLSTCVATRYSDIIAFEPDPEYFHTASMRIEAFFREQSIKPRVTLVNAAVSDKDGKVDLHVTKNPASSSLSPNKDTTANKNTISVECVMLYNYLLKKGIPYVDHYVSDIQGSDYTTLHTMKPYINKKLIGSMFIETQSDDTPQIYTGLENRLSDFKALLEDNYFIESIYGDYNPDINSLERLDDDPNTLPDEFDVHWKKK